jgi:hypothetical protein
MKKKHPFLDWLGGTGLAILAVLVFGMGLVSFGMGHRQELNRLDQQKEDIEELMSLISQGAEQRRDKEGFTTLPGIDQYPKQVGSAIDGCEMTSNGCQATMSGCINLRYLERDPYLSLPADVIAGSEKRSGYVVWLEGADTLVVASCAPEYQEVRTKIPGLMSMDEMQSKMEKTKVEMGKSNGETTQK